MTRHTFLRRGVIVFGAFAVLAVSGFTQAPSASAMTCFAVAGKISCINTTIAPDSGFMPPFIVPNGPASDGEDHDIVIQDDGGRRMARG